MWGTSFAFHRPPFSVAAPALVSPNPYRSGVVVLISDTCSDHLPRAMASSHPPDTEGFAAGVCAGPSVIGGGRGHVRQVSE